MNTQNPLAVTYGEETYDFGALPQTTLVAMLRRGVSHFFGSEAASKVLTKIEAGITEGTDEANTKARKERFEALDSAARRAAIKQFRDANAELIAQWTRDVHAEQVKAMEAGTVGVSVRGPSVDPLTAIITRLGKAEVLNVLKANKIAVPKKADDVVKFPNGDTYTVAQLVARRLDPAIPAGVDAKGQFGKAGEAHRDRITREAKKIMADQEKAAKKAGEADLDL